MDTRAQQPPHFWMYRPEPMEQENIRPIGQKLSRVQQIMSTIPHRCSIMTPDEYDALIARTSPASEIDARIESLPTVSS